MYERSRSYKNELQVQLSCQARALAHCIFQGSILVLVYLGFARAE